MKFLRFSFTLLMIGLFAVSCELPDEELTSGDKLVVAYSEAISSYSPLDFEAKNRKYLTNMYETLVRYDKSFNYETGLSVSWGRSDDLTWEFKLREGVTFHNGTAFDADDAVYSLELAMNDEESQLASLLGSIQAVEKLDDYKIKITTHEPDPLLLNKLTSVFMLPLGYSDFLTPTGTGPYVLSDFGEDSITLSRFPDYWGPAPFYESVELRTIPNTEDRLNAMSSGEIDVLANVPPQFVTALEDEGVELQVFPSLELSYLMLNSGGPLADPNLREVVWKAIGTDYASEFGDGFLLPTNQYAARGIFGYTPDIEERVQDLSAALKIRETIEDEFTLEVDVPMGLEALGERVASDLNAANINVALNVLPLHEFEARVLSGTADIYFFGWKYDLADVSDFYETVVHSRDGQYGEFNGINYANSGVDEGIEQASTVLDVSARRELLKEVFDLVKDDRVIIPLFEAQVIYALSPDVHWSVRLDGQILASEIMGNVVE